MLGILPQALYELDLWEFHSCIKAYNTKKELQDKESFVQAWQMANLTGAAFGGKLKPLKHYLKEGKVQKGKRLTKEQMDDFDKRFEEKERRRKDE